jgi:ABC-2 type transport system permease protein
LIRGIAQASFLGHFSAITRGVIDLRDVVYFLSIMIAFLAANAIVIDLEKAE